jgi:hypothetical protein
MLFNASRLRCGSAVLEVLHYLGARSGTRVRPRPPSDPRLGRVLIPLKRASPGLVARYADVARPVLKRLTHASIPDDTPGPGPPVPRSLAAADGWERVYV